MKEARQSSVPSGKGCDAEAHAGVGMNNPFTVPTTARVERNVLL